MTRDPQRDLKEAERAFDPVTSSGGSSTSHVEPEEPHVSSPHAKRFAFLTAALLVLATVAILGAGMLASEEERPGSATLDLTWAPFQPRDKDPDVGSREIADAIARQYKLDNRKQLVAITGGAMEVQGLPINLAIREPAVDGGEIDLLPGSGVLYRMCGLGPNCSIDQGQPSESRLLLLKRQALELALYSFKYLKETDNVVVFLPAGKTPAGEVRQDSRLALFFQKDQLKAQLSQPLAKTLPGAVPTPSTMRKAPASQEIEQFTNARLYDYSLTQANSESSVFLVMDPILGEPALPSPKESAGNGSGGKSSGQNGGGGTQSSGGSQSGTGGPAGAPSIQSPLSPNLPD